MHKIETVRGYHYGTKKARLYRDIAVERRTWRDRLEDMLLLCVLFDSHRTYKDRLESTRPKGHVYLPDFRELIRSLLVEWSDSNLLATVFVWVANRHFLPLFSNISYQNQYRLPGPARTPSFSKTSTPLRKPPCLSRRYSPCSPSSWACTTSGDTADALTRTTKTQVGTSASPHGHRASLTLLACFAALLWAILSFTVAIAAFRFVGSANVHTRTLLGTVLGVLLALTVLTVLVF
ncbi:hypothetical protein EDB84DRAFT_1556877 [Lactarius hengduanensis]|nr:hypothetical protein EDB84DRAFT_1556877 [Lactarius hengduanensis]